MRFVKAAHTANRLVILGVSSNRAATTVLNAMHQSLLGRVKAKLKARRTLRTVRALARAADGVFLAGHGLRSMLGTVETKVHVGTASWVTREDMVDEAVLQKKLESENRGLRLCAAARLEPMKGIHLAVDALRLLHEHQAPGQPPAKLEILGEGAEQDALIDRVEQYGLRTSVEFGGTHSYPGPFFDAIRRHDLLLITNLNVEQPRIIFDAISQGLIPICPDTVPYRELGLDQRVRYRCGDAESLALTVRRFISPRVRNDVMPDLRDLARRHTLESMHELRAAWIEGLLERR